MHQIEPTKRRLRALTGLKTAVIDDYFTGTEEIVKRYSNSLVPTLPTAYGGIWRSHRGYFTPKSFEFTKYETINGSLGYRLLPLGNFIIQDPKLKSGSPSGSFVMIATQLLKELGLIHTLTGFNTAVNIAASTIKLLWATTLQDGRVYHDNSALRYLNRYDKHNRIVHKSENPKCDGLFYRDSHTGNVVTGSFKYHLSRRGDTFMRDLVQRYMELALGETKMDIKSEDMLVSPEEIKRLHTRDQVVLLSRCAGAREGKLHIVNDLKDTQDSRVYGLMVMLTSRARSILGYLQYDIAAALQSIVFDVLDAKAPYDAAMRFPAHFEMIIDRKAFRLKIADEVGRDIAWVKVSLTKIDNGGSVDKGYSASRKRSCGTKMKPDHSWTSLWRMLM